MNVLFLDYDGVVNTSMWNETGTKCRYNFPEDGKVNNFQAIQWISEFCQCSNYSIVVISSWRRESNYKECLINGGLRAGIEILGRTSVGVHREEGILEYLAAHQSILNFIIVDDFNCYTDPRLIKRLIQTREDWGFGKNDFMKCVNLARELAAELI